MGIDLSAEVVEDDEVEALTSGLFIQVAFRPQRRPGYKRNLVASLRQELTAYQRVFLRPA
jgi:hypothetical protein